MKKLLVVLVLLFGTGSFMAQTKIGHVNSQTLLDTLPSRKEALKKLQDFEKNGYKELQEMQADFQKQVAVYQEKLPTMSPVIKQIEEEKLMKKEQAMQDRQQSLSVEMQAYSEELNGPILKRVQDAVKIVAERKKVNYVIDESTTLYFETGMDLTQEVLTELLRLDAEASK